MNLEVRLNCLSYHSATECSGCIMSGEDGVQGTDPVLDAPVSTLTTDMSIFYCPIF